MQMEFKGISMAINDYYFASFNFHCELRILLKLRIFSESRLSAESLAVDGDAVRLTDAVRLLRLLLLETWLMKFGGQRWENVADRRAVDRLDADCKPVAQFLFNGQNKRLLHALQHPTHSANFHQYSMKAYSEYKHSLTFCVRAMLSQQRNPCTDCKSA